MWYYPNWSETAKQANQTASKHPKQASFVQIYTKSATTDTCLMYCIYKTYRTDNEGYLQLQMHILQPTTNLILV